jgi:uncharacterized protein YjiK
VNVEDKGEIAVIDTKTWKKAATWKLADCEEPSGLAINEQQDTLFTVCGNSKMLVINAKTGKVISTVRLERAPTPLATTRAPASLSLPMEKGRLPW